MPDSRMDWFPWYANDFLNSRRVKRMSDANVGRYVKLLSESWLHGALPVDMGEMGELIGLTPARMTEAWAQLRPAFTETPEGYVNDRLEQIRAEQSGKMERKAELARRAAEKRWENERNADAMQTHSGRNAIREEKNRTEKKKEEYSSAFLEAMDLYPKREGGNPKPSAWRAWKARLDEGHTPLVLTEGVRRYAALIRARGDEGTRYVKMAATFFGRDLHFLEPMQVSDGKVVGTIQAPSRGRGPRRWESVTPTERFDPDAAAS